jgi:hypothetical protein
VRAVSRLSLILAAVIAALLVTPAAGQAAKLRYHSCSGTKYWLIASDANPQVKLLRIKMRSAKADGYAPRCLVAEGVAGEVQQAVIDDGKQPKNVHVMGAQWDMRSTCSYTAQTGYTQVQCVAKRGNTANTVRFRLVPNG